MKKYISKTLLIVCLFLLSGCHPGDKFKRNYILENGTEHKIELKFYRYGPQSIDFEGQNILNNKGDIFLQYVIENPWSAARASGAFRCDSLFIIFDDSRKGKIIVNGDTATTGLISTILEGIDKNILLDEVYTIKNNENYRYVFTEQDYNNAINCNGNCD